MENTKQCPYCGEEILAVAKKCKHCGEWLTEDVKPEKQIPCPICGEPVNASLTVCPHCNEPIEQDKIVRQEAKPDSKSYTSSQFQNSTSNNRPLFWIIGGVVVLALIFYAIHQNSTTQESNIAITDSTSSESEFIPNITEDECIAREWEKGFYKNEWGETNESDPYVECPGEFNGKLRTGKGDASERDASLRIKLDKRGLQFSIHSDYCDFTSLQERVYDVKITLRTNGQDTEISPDGLEFNTFYFAQGESLFNLMNALGSGSFDILFEGFQIDNDGETYTELFNANFHVINQSTVFKEALEFFSNHNS